MALSPLSYKDVGSIVYDFDHAKFNVIHRPRETVIQEQIIPGQFNYFLFRENGLPVELIDRIATAHITSQPSVGALLNFYVGLPYLEGRTTVLADCQKANGYLNASAKVLLGRLNIAPSKNEGELVHFKQLMNIVFAEHFSQLTSEKKLEMLQRFQIKLWDQKNPEEKLHALERLLEYDQAIRDRVKMHLQFFSWRVQLVAGRVMQYRVFQACVSMVAYGVVVAVLGLLAYTIGNFALFIDKAVEDLISEDANYYVLNAVITASLTVSLMCIASLAVFIGFKVKFFVDSYGNQKPWYISYPVEGFTSVFTAIGTAGIQKLPDVFSRYAVAKVNAISKSMDEMATQYCNDQLPELLPRWHQLILHPPIVNLQANQ